MIDTVDLLDNSSLPSSSSSMDEFDGAWQLRSLCLRRSTALLLCVILQGERQTNVVVAAGVLHQTSRRTVNGYHGASSRLRQLASKAS